MPAGLKRGPAGRAEAQRSSAVDRGAVVRRQDHHALAKVGGLTLMVREPAVVEELKEQAPDIAMCLLELVEEHDRERIRPDRCHERGRVAIRARVGQEALEAGLGLELGHVEPHETIRRPEEKLGQRLRNLRLARTGRPDEQEHAERTGRIGEVRLDQRDPLDEAVDRSGLPDDPSGEEAAYLLEVERRVGIDDV
jgi:hypothetical protein